MSYIYIVRFSHVFNIVFLYCTSLWGDKGACQVQINKHKNKHNPLISKNIEY